MKSQKLPHSATAPQPTSTFWSEPPDLPFVVPVHFNARQGWRVKERGQKVPLTTKAQDSEKGSLTWWLLPREDFATSVLRPWMSTYDPGHHVYLLLADRDSVDGACDPSLCHFGVLYERAWYQQMQVFWHPGKPYPESPEDSFFNPRKPKAYIGLGHCSLNEGHWLQIGISWDEPASDYRLYINGVLVQTATTTLDIPLLRAKSSGTLFAGHPLFAMGELAFYQDVLGAADFRDIYLSSKPMDNEGVDAGLAGMHAGQSTLTCDWQPDSSWNAELSLPLNREEDLERFYIQGMTSAPALTDEGLRVTTAPLPKDSLNSPKPPDWDEREIWDPAQVYLWLEDSFSGDFAVEYEFKSLQSHGLSLLMTRAAGMQGEEFLKQQPRRKSGAMRMVAWENVRNYHWEYYRQMEDCRNDVASHVLVKNPYLYPLTYKAMDKKLAVGEWHTLRFVHEGNHIIGSIDNLRVIDVHDHSFIGSGPVFRNGTMAIRCMFGSDMVFRKLKIWTRPMPY